jgi:hypothetical protein
MASARSALPQRPAPRDVAVEQARTAVALQPLRNHRLCLGDRAILEHRVGECVDCVGVFRPQVERALRQRPAVRDVAVLGVGPAATGEKPPVVATVLAGVTLAQVHPRLVVTGHAGEREQAERPKRQRHDHRIAWPVLEMAQRPLKGLLRLPLGAQRERLYVAAIAPRTALRDAFGAAAARTFAGPNSPRIA